ncbi:MAG TPA: hypothetical protein VFF31_33320 [Blastocatellia bacterium]|nr:hypothetical protein [Blastocatellia bacterium]
MPVKSKSGSGSSSGTGGTGGSGGTGSPGTGSPGTGSPGTGSPGTGKVKDAFFKALGKHMAKKGWRTVSIPGFDWAAIESAHFDIDSLVAAFDADYTDILEGAHLKLSRWADGGAEKMPETRIAIAVFDNVSAQQAEYITKELQKGNRMGIQSMTAVVNLKTGRLFEPQEVGGVGAHRIRINKPVFDELKAVVQILAATY